MKMAQIKEIANAVLYEGYLLYPYRHSAIKNRQRWTFGVLYPHEYSEQNGGQEPWSIQTECIFIGQPQTELLVTARFLHLLRRSVESPAHPMEPVVDHWSPDAWEEGIEREISSDQLLLADLLDQPLIIEIAYAGNRLEEHLPGEPSAIVREHQPLTGAMSISAQHIDSELYKLTVQIENTTVVIEEQQQRRDAILLQSFVSTHALLQVQRGSFISLIDPPATLQPLVHGCNNRHTWPVLVGNEGECDALLSAPIILYDYPQIAPESAGALFDGTEIDEILTLRIMTLTDEEKQEMRAGDARAREILERTESLTADQFMQLHGALHTLGTLPAEEPRAYIPPPLVMVDGQQVKAGAHVRLHPGQRADAFDFLLEGKTGRIETIQQDFEQRIHLIVTLDDDPGREQWDERMLPGHRFFFAPEEVELLEERV
ncbi:hypothetical protein [Tengunoibacter tsumagoiensis]|uniref:Uncharacterized protein n=1 Tax=Tengunoibacter tsumagoiensis TaxID=2014871 RepID=A0A402A156_9CHLR|nr:hypothetical protein [Tengunoibacter tsumagoiensis]GCE12789.1 hypothetical protein KTT_26480 [Tengunoibacter tsumagoiensis]